MTIKKLILGGLVAVAAIAVVSYAVTGFTHSPAPAASSQAQVDSAPAASPKAPQNVVFKLSSDALLKQDYATVDELGKSTVVETIVKGTVTGTQDIYTDAVPYRVLTVDVQRSFKKRVTGTIRVYEDGAYVKVKDVLPELQAHMDASQLTTDQVENGVVDFAFMGAPHSQVGDTVVLYLKKNPNVSQGDSYQIVSSVHGRFTQDRGTKEYRRHDGESRPGFETKVGVDVLEKKLESIR